MHLHTRGERRTAVVILALALLAGPAAASVQSELAFHRGVVAYGEGHYDEARRQFQLVIDEDPDDPVTLHYLGLVASKQGDAEAALGFYDRAIALDPEDADIAMDRGLALLDAGRLQEAREAFARVIQLEPDRARAHLFAGVAAYRMGAYAQALPELDRAAELDPGIRAESRYYAGLVDAFQGNVEAASSAFDDVAQQSPLSPLGQSAQNLREQMAPTPVPRAWKLGITGGMEYDSNPLILGDLGPSTDADGRGVVRVSGSYRLVSLEEGSLTVGYDGYWGFQIDETQVNLQTHNGWVSGAYNLGPARLGLRYDYAFTFIDTTERFRSLNRVTPSVALREGDWGVSYLFYQYHNQDFLLRSLEDTVFDRDGDRHIPGMYQYFFLPEPFTYVRMGLAGDFTRTDGTEWDYNGLDASFGCGYDFDHGIGLTWLYRYLYQDYLNPSAVSVPPFSETRVDHRHIFTVELSKTLGEHWRVAAGAALTWNNSTVAFYEYDRQVGGAYVTYTF